MYVTKYGYLVFIYSLYFRLLTSVSLPISPFYMIVAILYKYYYKMITNKFHLYYILIIIYNYIFS